MQSFDGVIRSFQSQQKGRRGLILRFRKEDFSGTKAPLDSLLFGIDFLECNTALTIHSQKLRFSQKNSHNEK